MITFLLVLLGLIAFNFILLKFSMQSVDSKKKNTNSGKVQINHITEQETEKSKIQEAA